MLHGLTNTIHCTKLVYVKKCFYCTYRDRVTNTWLYELMKGVFTVPSPLSSNNLATIYVPCGLKDLHRYFFDSLFHTSNQRIKFPYPHSQSSLQQWLDHAARSHPRGQAPIRASHQANVFQRPLQQPEPPSASNQLNWSRVLTQTTLKAQLELHITETRGVRHVAMIYLIPRAMLVGRLGMRINGRMRRGMMILVIPCPSITIKK